jgi:hypothetical protein
MTKSNLNCTKLKRFFKGSQKKRNRLVLPRSKAHSLCLLIICSIQLFTVTPALAAATLNFDAGIAEGVNPLLKLILTHNGKAIFLSSAIGMLLGGGNNDGWTRLKMGGLWAVGAAALIHIMKGTLGVAMPA